MKREILVLGIKKGCNRHEKYSQRHSANPISKQRQDLQDPAHYYHEIHDQDMFRSTRESAYAYSSLEDK